MNEQNRARMGRAYESVRNEWHEAPWFVILIIAIAAFVGPGILWAIWRALTTWF